MDSQVLIVAVLAIAVIVLYVGGRYYLRTGEGFKDVEEDEERRKARRMAEEHAPTIYDTAAIRNDFHPEAPFTEQPILRLDDYEYSMIFQNEGSREVGKRVISDAMSRYPLGWTVQPPSSQYFQTRQEGFVSETLKEDAEERTGIRQPVNTEEFNSISGTKEQPQDKELMEEEERKILQMYKPEKSKDLIHYSLKDAKRLVKRLYSKRGLIADVERSKQGNNVFEIVEVREKDPVIVWEDDIPQPERDSMRGEEVIEVPQTVNDLSAGLDPWYEPRTRTRMGRHDYTKWTPGLERSFAPTYTATEWS